MQPNPTQSCSSPVFVSRGHVTVKGYISTKNIKTSLNDCYLELAFDNVPKCTSVFSVNSRMPATVLREERRSSVYAHWAFGLIHSLHLSKRL